MRKPFLLLCTLAALLLNACTPKGDDSPRQRMSFNTDWQFSLDNGEWRQLNLPHDWAIEGTFSKDNPSGTSGGALPGGYGVYKKTFKAAADWKDKCVFIDFDGVFMNSTVVLNGHELGTRPYGYISFRYELTPHLRFDADNELEVRVDNTDQPNSRWYSGCGIYRNVWLVVTEPTHIAHWGVYAVPEANGNVTVSVEQCGEAEVRNTILTAEGCKIAEGTNRLHVENPHLWDVGDPYLYTLRTQLWKDGALVDEIDTRIGFRSIRFDVAEGFFLNDRPLKINGVCQHHDLGCLGSAMNRRALQRQLEILKGCGVNAIRCSHNPPSPELLDLADEMGFLIMDEAFDMWYRRKTRFDYARFFNDWYERDLTDLVKRDRNHPSIILWSIGNEVLEQWQNASADKLSADEANFVLNFGHQEEQLGTADVELSVNSLLTRKLASIVKKLDNTRLVTAGCNNTSPDNQLFLSGAIDVIGFNYHNADVLKAPENFPGKPFVITESNSSIHTRGYYRMPSDSVYVAPGRGNNNYVPDPTMQCSAYDNSRVPWGHTHEETLDVIKHNPYVSGQFIWTGFDYIGEPTPYPWPAHSSYFGFIDLCGFPKDAYYLYQSEWTDQTVLYLFPHWNWQPLQEVDVWCYYNKADSVELFLNDRSLGCSAKSEHRFHAQWRVTFEPGTLRAVSYKNGVVVAERQVRTAGAPARIKLTPDRTELKADGTDLSFITVEVTDEEGNLCPFADNDIQFSLSGKAFIAGVGNGNPISLEAHKADHRRAFNGKCLLVVQNQGAKGKVKVTASASGLAEASTILRVKK